MTRCEAGIDASQVLVRIFPSQIGCQKYLPYGRGTRESPRFPSTPSVLLVSLDRHRTQLQKRFFGLL